MLPQAIHRTHGKYVKSYDDSGDQSRQMEQISDLIGITKSGIEIPLAISIQKHPEGSLSHFTAICRDISKKNERENRVKQEHAKFKALFDTSHHFTILMNGKGHVLELNNTAVQFINDNPQKYIGLAVWDCNFWANEIDYSLIENAVSTIKQDDQVTLIVNAKDSTNCKVILEITLKTVWLESEKSTLIVLEGKDITDIVRSNKALTESRSRLARAQNIAQIGSCDWNLVTNEMAWSDEGYRILGFSPKSVNIDYDFFLNLVHPNDKEKIEQAIVACLSDDVPYKIVHRIIMPEGTEKVVEAIGEVIRTKAGDPIKMVGTIQDVTLHWKRERDLIVAKKKAEKANIAKAQFLSTISHELKTPLNAIIGFSSMIAEQQLGELKNKFYLGYAEYINTSGHELMTLIQDLLHVTNYDLGSIKCEPSCFSAQSMFDEILPRLIKKASSKRINIEVTISDDVPELCLDLKHTQKILEHLIDNAIKFSVRESSIKVNLSHKNNEILIEVIDVGIGIEDADIEKIFDLFVQKDMKPNRAYGGVGVGLTIVKNLVDVQGGQITVESKSGQGSLFAVFLPQQTEEFSILDQIA